MGFVATKGKYFRIDEDFSTKFDAWCDSRRWLNQGALIESLLKYAMNLSREDLIKLLDDAVHEQPPKSRDKQGSG